MPGRDHLVHRELGAPKLGWEWDLGGLQGLVFERHPSHPRGKSGFQVEGRQRQRSLEQPALGRYLIAPISVLHLKMGITVIN